jgi:DsbC/DsbD-like thiol-disulfide interchange protein
LGLALLAGQCAAPEGGAQVAEPQVGLHLVADVAAPGPGAEFQLVALFDIPEGWHIYWENSGDSGLPTRVEVEGPAGSWIGDPIFPGPLRILAPGGIENFGYEGEAAVFVPVRAPLEPVAGDRLEFRLRAEWLLCREICFLQTGAARLVLGRGGGSAPLAPEITRTLARWREQLPRPTAELDGLKVEWNAEGPRWRLRLEVPGASELEYFPSLRDSSEWVRSDPAGAGAGLVLECRRSSNGASLPPGANGLLRVRRAGTSRFFELVLAPQE